MYKFIFLINLQVFATVFLLRFFLTTRFAKVKTFLAPVCILIKKINLSRNWGTVPTGTRMVDLGIVKTLRVSYCTCFQKTAKVTC